MVVPSSCLARHGLAVRGKVGPGMAGQGGARLGMAWHGRASLVAE